MGRSRARPLLHLVRVLSPLDRADPAGTAPSRMSKRNCRRLPRWASTFSTCRPFIPSAAPSARAKQHRHRRSPATWAARGPLAASEGGHTSRFIRSWARLTDFDQLVAATREHGMEIALDIAFQCSPDHPWVKEHPDVVQPSP